ncbi:truncated hemoglobin [Thiomicrorhabdus sediminis]|uniref:Group 1 truncated hemoglobin n=1 Tax=Thiomicrorhabdus sediminis TaxID=2580412 RepID=A0A4P9K4T7_9GAMM|nr:group 1 truncated hemoglobin [Thiomicrorhabdus sediminis]QCU89962.1 group 1 truncated hemoglobin [Thiomicrorhabdus sediminis]
MTTLYQRLGGKAVIRQIASDVVAIHYQHPYTHHRYSAKHIPTVERETTNFFTTITGGPHCFNNNTLAQTKQDLAMEEAEFTSILDDVLLALERNQVAQREQEEVLYMLYQLKHSFTLN